MLLYESHLPQLLVSRICHDLAGPIGTVGNCLDLIFNEQQMIREQAQKLAVSESAKLVSKIQFLRFVYGFSEKKELINSSEVVKLLENFYDNSKVSIEINVANELTYIDMSLAKAILSLTSIVFDSAVSGTMLHVNVSGAEYPEKISIVANVAINRINPKLINLLTTGSGLEIDVLNCREYYVFLLCKNAGYEIMFERNLDLVSYYIIKK